jgi:small subunit ribosomal protein S9
MPGWIEFKETLIRRAKTPDEVQAINELTPQEAEFFMDPKNTDPEAEAHSQTRIVPANRNYYSGQPVVEQRLQDVEAVMEKYNHLPKAPQHLWAIREWKNSAAGSNTEINSDAGSFDQKSLKGKYVRAMITIGKELNKIHPVLMPPELREWLDDFAPLRDVSGAGLRQKRVLDKFQRSKGNGKRKTARAKVQIVPGEGLIYINGKLAAEHFSRTKDVENVIWPLQSLGALGQYNVWVSTWGGGTTGLSPYDCLILGQSEACKLAVARAMLAHDKSGGLNQYRKLLRKG